MSGQASAVGTLTGIVGIEVTCVNCEVGGAKPVTGGRETDRKGGVSEHPHVAAPWGLGFTGLHSTGCKRDG